jgi:hypothetical protein
VTRLEFVFVLGWLLLPPLLLGTAALAVLHRRSHARRMGRTVGAGLLLAFVSTVLAVGFVALGPSSLGRIIGVQDAPFMWAPFAFFAVALAFPLVLLWARRGERP